MKNLILILSLFSVSAFAKSIKVNCAPPARFSGQGATVKGTLEIGTKRNGSYLTVAGKLSIRVGGSSATPLYNKRVSVKGVILDDGSLNLMSDRHPELTAIYLNPNVKDLSNLEVDGEQFLINCRK